MEIMARGGIYGNFNYKYHKNRAGGTNLHTRPTPLKNVSKIYARYLPLIPF